MNTVHYMSQSNEWATPDDLFLRLDLEYGFTLDPCSSDGNAKCEKHFTPIQDGLKQDWSKDRVFMNPPYGKEIGKWCKKAYEESLKGALVVGLIPSRTDTHYWHEYVMKATKIEYIRGRVKFGNSKSGAPFPSAIVVWKESK